MLTFCHPSPLAFFTPYAYTHKRFPRTQLSGVKLDGERPSWLREHEVSRLQHALCESHDNCSPRTAYVLSLMCDILVLEWQRPTAAQVAVRASGILGRLEQQSADGLNASW